MSRGVWRAQNLCHGCQREETAQHHSQRPRERGVPGLVARRDPADLYTLRLPGRQQSSRLSLDSGHRHHKCRWLSRLACLTTGSFLRDYPREVPFPDLDWVYPWTRPGVRRCSTNRPPNSRPRYRLAIARRAVLPPSGTSRGAPSMVRPRNGGSVSKTMSEHRGTRSKWRSLASPSAITTSRSCSWRRNHTGDTAALPSLRYVVNTAGEGRSRGV